jgi:hypothetical protein
MINEFVTVFAQNGDQVILQLIPGVITANVYAHASTIPDLYR